jgi:hypothetical protein
MEYIETAQPAGLSKPDALKKTQHTIRLASYGWPELQTTQGITAGVHLYVSWSNQFVSLRLLQLIKNETTKDKQCRRHVDTTRGPDICSLPL